MKCITSDKRFWIYAQFIDDLIGQVWVEYKQPFFTELKTSPRFKLYNCERSNELLIQVCIPFAFWVNSKILFFNLARRLNSSQWDVRGALHALPSPGSSGLRCVVLLVPFPFRLMGRQAIDDLELGALSYPVDESCPASSFICAGTLCKEQNHLNWLDHLGGHLL